MTNQQINIDDANIKTVIDKVAIEGRRIVIHQAGKPMAALVPLEELEILEELEELEDQLDIQAAEEAIKESGAVSWEDVKLRFGL
ncbi:MAG: type II toxin-antitoxin system prevent-host-death family antitoxin [Dolichospermum sp. DEX189]|jgi:prevent-host-death family protein|uniref:Antitoxin n=1 Tax=Dolichospermum compactum NIES-806 TaxID=1973481 RepID=A0A1Z4V7I1_9CYAN|nr:type II toxin-antitoxin system prevent-host-death family antitoxin [Dolichospermum compactum]MBO1071870.1 type II toxin-antitoxin system prevent-host-death family antitoxin [Dolichospermum sp. DEX189]MDK2408817.1 type II toxin-antitoxin system prevent-host-death family antitoxin [Aphanizomenon sp. 202]MDK2459715.1 type II toxin-antitoxin system prevent-host-death family antitoxin [Aphanizomenon sp. PH219]BAZ87404.1 prevent-host-death family protein [Dolichospermum compactum NIES-806]